MLHPRFVALAFVLSIFTVFAAPAIAEAIAVDVANATKPTTCAEEDNVYFKLLSPDAKRFTIEALQPVYMSRMAVDVQGPDFTSCGISDKEDFAFDAKEVVLHEDSRLIVKGFTFARFWRKGAIPTVVNGRTTAGLHLIQVFTKRAGQKPFEFLVLYPADGYWRARPRPLPQFAENVYGSSFLIGPIEEKGRPVADVASVEIVPDRREFRLKFVAGGGATLVFGEPSRQRLSLDVTIDRTSVDAKLPFAGLRSMYVNETNSDTARVVWQAAPGGPIYGRDVPRFDTGVARDIRFDRANPSVHNTSAPDMIFRNFRR